METLRQVSEAMELPKDLLFGDAMISMCGYQEMCIENFTGIIEYQPDYIRVQGKNCKICIQGEKLFIEHYSNEELKIQGNITQLSFEKR